MCLKKLVSHSICTQIYYILTFFSLLHLKSEVESSDGEVDRLWVGLADGAEEVEDVVALLPHQAGEQLRYPWQPQDWRYADVVLINSFCQCSLQGPSRGRGVMMSSTATDSPGTSQTVPGHPRQSQDIPDKLAYIVYVWL